MFLYTTQEDRTNYGWFPVYDFKEMLSWDFSLEIVQYRSF